MKINTAFGKKLVIRRVGVAREYYYTAPTPSAPNGEWWLLNEQKGYIPVPSNSRALQYARAFHP